MQVSYQFAHNMIDLSVCENFIPHIITTTHPISTLKYIINNHTIQKLDFTIINKIFNIKTEDDFGEYEYDLRSLDLQPFVSREQSHIEICAGNISLVANIHGVIADDDDNDFMVEYYESKQYNINTIHPVCYNINTNIFYIIYDSAINEQNLDALVYDGHVLVDFTYERISSTCYKINSVMPNCLLKITSLIDQTIDIVHKHEHTLLFDGSSNVMCVNNGSKSLIFEFHDQNKNKDIDVSMPSDMRIKITQIVSSELEYATCPITQDDIEHKERYYKCQRCSNAFGFEMMNRWLKTNKSCPLCKLSWPDTDTIYINTNESFVHKIVPSNKNKNINIMREEHERRQRLINNVNNVYTSYINELD